MPFPKALAGSEILTASSSIWTQITNFISYNDNHFTKHAFYPYLPTPPLKQDMSQGQFLSGV